VARFTWVPIFEELADELLKYRERQAELIDSSSGSEPTVQ
jgi:hypothetical protein